MARVVVQGDEWENLSPLAHTIVFGICSVEDCIVGKTKYPSFLFTMFFFLKLVHYHLLYLYPFVD